MCQVTHWWVFRPHFPALQPWWHGVAEAPQTHRRGTLAMCQVLCLVLYKTLSQLILKLPREADLIISSIKSFVQGKTTSRWWSWDSNTDTLNIKAYPLSITLDCLSEETLPQRAYSLWKQDVKPPNKSSGRLFADHWSSFTNVELEDWRILVKINQWLFFIFCMGDIRWGLGTDTVMVRSRIQNNTPKVTPWIGGRAINHILSHGQSSPWLSNWTIYCY